MVKWATFLWLFILPIFYAQEIPFIQTYVLVSEIEDSYTIVKSYLYPSETKNNRFVAATAPDYYVTKLMADKPTIGIYFEIESHKDIPFVPAKIQIPKIAEYLATKDIYPNAANQSQPILSAKQNRNPNPSVPLQPEKKPNLLNLNKKIEWKANDVLPLMNSIVEDGVEVQLRKSELIRQTGIEQI
jgi:hypothetical protein